jgi:hypothetical protein
MDRFDRELLNSPDIVEKKSRMAKKGRLSKDFDRAVKKIAEDISSPGRAASKQGKKEMQVDRSYPAVGSPGGSPLLKPKGAPGKNKELKAGA